jgi:hypothetical protein
MASIQIPTGKHIAAHTSHLSLFSHVSTSESAMGQTLNVVAIFYINESNIFAVSISNAV